MAEWHDIGALDALPDREGKLVEIGGEPIAIFRDGESVHAIDDLCPHQGASLSTGSYHGGRVICPWHDWIFDTTTGRCPRDTHEPVRAHATRVRDGRVEVALPADEA